ncbi:phage tail protein [Metasolibacillus fluoroglycofenilyticus]|uniref:phage tail-collar fiber domain-containing protein n=1 Tax=Metasolibacillus fluoroglycofenilyticus TaxID=1239396 RepID=UPI000D37C502|nr:phage tail protein [Metasolibacillus fluoroglycofenilyticus]
MAQYGTIITNSGLAQIANAQATQTKVGLEYIALGDGNGAHYIPTQNQSALVNEVWRGAVANVTIDPANSNRIIVDGVIPTTAGGFTIREIGVFDAQNQLIAVGQYPEKYKPQLSEGTAEEILIHFVLETNNSDIVELSIDPSIIIASRKYVDKKVDGVERQFAEHLDNFDAHGLNKFYSLAHAQEIVIDMDLNDIKTLGNYVSNSANVTTTLLNCPVTTNSGFTMKVERVTGDSINFLRQTIKVNHQIPTTFERTMINNVFSPWYKIIITSNLTWIEATPQNGWQQPMEQYMRLQYIRDSLGIVHVRGEILGGAIIKDTIITTLPVGYRPTSTIPIQVIRANDASFCPIQINSRGEITIMQSLSATSTLRFNSNFFVGV